MFLFKSLRRLLLLALLLLLAACEGRPWVDSTQPQVQTLTPNDSLLGQTFVANHAGLTAIDLYLAPTGAGEATVTLYLRSNPASQTDLASATLSLPGDAEPTYHRFPFAPLADSNGQSYYVAWASLPTNTLQTGVGGGLTYLDGGLLRDHEAVDAQAAFRLVYDPRYILLDLGTSLVRMSGWLTLVTLLFLLPGLALLCLSGVDQTLDWAERITVAAGLGFAFYPTLLLWTHQLGLALGAGHVWLTLVVSLTVLIGYGWREWQRGDLRRLDVGNRWPGVALLVVAGVIFFSRLLVIQNLEAPLWGDSVQHAAITQLLLDHGGLFQSWEPYAPYATLTTHFGFSAAAATLAWPTALSNAQATLMAGQLVNGLAVLTIYPLAKRIANGNPWAGVAAVAAAGLISEYPAFYVNWGRYAQLAGQALLPTALWLTWRVAEARPLPWRGALLLGCTLCGMMLTYYRMPYYYATFVLPWLLCWALPTWRFEGRRWLTGLGGLGLAAVAGLAFFLPWALNAFDSSLVNLATARVSADTPAELAAQYRQATIQYVIDEYRGWLLLPTFVPYSLLIGAGLALVWSLLRRQVNVLLVFLWMAGLASLVAAQLIGLPGANLMQNFAVLIALYIPVSLCIGWLFAAAVQTIESRQPRLGDLLAMAAMLMVIAWSLPRQLAIVKPEYVMVTRPDSRAMHWIAEQTPVDARFLVAGFRIMDDTQIVGADAGWWIPLLAGRANTMPPQYAILNERPNAPDTTARLVELVGVLEESKVSDPEVKRLLCANDITHVYIGQRQGAVGFGVTQLFAPADFADDPAFSLVYHQDLVHIYQFDRQTCASRTT